MARQETWFDAKLSGRPLLRDVILVLFLVFGFAAVMVVVFSRPTGSALLSGLVFAVVYLGTMEWLERRKGRSMFRTLSVREQE